MHVSYTLWEGIFPNSLGMFSTRNKAKLMVHSSVLTFFHFRHAEKLMPTSLWLFSALLAMSAMKKSRGSTAEAAEYMANNTRTSESCWAAVNRPLSSGGGLVYDMDDECDRIRLECDIWVKEGSRTQETHTSNSESGH